MTTDTAFVPAVIGATGKTGRRVTAALRAAGHPVRALSRPVFDWTDPSTWRPALAGATAAYVTYAPDLAFPGGPEAVADLADLAGRLGLARIVLLSGRNEPEAQRAEGLLRAAAARHRMAWAVVRSAFFWQNFTEDLFAPAIAAGHLRFVAGDVREPFLDADDLAAVACAVLTGDAPAGRVYELTGPRLLTFAAAAQEVADDAGIPFRYERVDAPAMVADLEGAGLDPESAEGITALFTEVLDGRNASLTDDVAAALGRAPRPFPARTARPVA
jgi:uncharacterized protein YbjT (DUF2867 family)